MSDNSGSKKGGEKGALPPLTFEHPAHAAEEGGEGNWLVSYADMMTLLVGFFVILLSFASVDPKKFDEARKSITSEFGGQYQVPYAKLADTIREIAKKLGIGDQFIIKESDLGIEISSRGTVFFESGSADLKEEAKPILAKMIDAIKSESTAFNITVEGHTDDVPIAVGHTIRNNFELSSLRACRVLEAFEHDSFPQDRLTAVGYGDTRPLVPNRDSSGTPIAENRAQNRRVVIKVLRAQTPVFPEPTPGAPSADVKVDNPPMQETTTPDSPDGEKAKE